MKLPVSEDQIQATCFQWAQMYPILRSKYWCIPNGGYNLSVPAQVKLKRLGRRKGLPDSMLFARDEHLRYVGLAVEFKTESTQLTAAQLLAKEDLIAEGWKFAVCRSLEEFMEIIKSYLGSRLTHG